MPDVADITIIGAGVVGLAIASAICRQGREVYLLEKNSSFGLEQSSRNSEAIHAGIYYEPGSLKARLCVEANAMLYELSQKAGIASIKCGKIIVAVNTAEDEALQELFQRGLHNGAPLQMLSQTEMHSLEPNMQGKSAFLSPTTGVIDAHGLMQYFLGKAHVNGLNIAYQHTVERIEKTAQGYEIRGQTPEGDFSFKTRILINSAGLHSDKIAQMAGINIDRAGYRIRWLKGNFYTVNSKRDKVTNRLIYTVPMTETIGAHVCYDVNWRLRYGPFGQYVDKLDYATEELTQKMFNAASIMQALPFMELCDLEPESSGIMAMLQGGNEGFCDFIIRHESDRGLPGFINLVGMDSPALTCSPAIGRYVMRLVNEIEGVSG